MKCLKLGKRGLVKHVSKFPPPVAGFRSSGRTALFALSDAVGVSQLEDRQHGQAGVQALVEVSRADLIPHNLGLLIFGIFLARILLLLVCGNYDIVKAGFILREVKDVGGNLFDYISSIWLVLEEEGEAGSQWEEKPKKS